MSQAAGHEILWHHHSQHEPYSQSLQEPLKETVAFPSSSLIARGSDGSSHSDVSIGRPEEKNDTFAAGAGMSIKPTIATTVITARPALTSLPEKISDSVSVASSPRAPIAHASNGSSDRPLEASHVGSDSSWLQVLSSQFKLAIWQLLAVRLCVLFAFIRVVYISYLFIFVQIPDAASGQSCRFEWTNHVKMISDAVDKSVNEVSLNITWFICQRIGA